jgi:uncharacterized protein (DUF58 family)
VQVRRCTQGICVLLLLLVSVAIVLDDPAILLPAAILGAGILMRYLLFGQRTDEMIRSVRVERSLSRDQVRKGMAVDVRTSVTFYMPPQCRATISDLLPGQANLESGTTEISAAVDPAPQSCTMSYTMVPVIHGTHRFSGIGIRIRDLFFEDSVTLSRESDTGPVLLVQPAGLFAPPPSELADGSLDMRRTSIWSGADVHSLRDYVVGDDLRHVDWKVSAKYDKLVIRKYTAPMSHPPLAIVDLPWKDAPFSDRAFSILISEVTGLVQHTIETYQHASVLLISGPNIIHLIREEKSAARCLAELREWMHPAERPVHFFRTPDRSDLRSRLREIESRLPDETDAATTAFYGRLQDRYESVLDHMRVPAFPGQVARALSQVTFSEVFLFTIECGDSSHIRHVARPLRARNVLVHIKVIQALPEIREADDTPGSTKAAGQGAAA